MKTGITCPNEDCNPDEVGDHSDDCASDGVKLVRHADNGQEEDLPDEQAVVPVQVDDVPHRRGELEPVQEEDRHDKASAGKGPQDDGEQTLELLVSLPRAEDDGEVAEVLAPANRPVVRGPPPVEVAPLR